MYIYIVYSHTPGMPFSKTEDRLHMITFTFYLLALLVYFQPSQNFLSRRHYSLDMTIGEQINGIEVI